MEKTVENPNSPYAVAQSLLEDFDNGRRTREDFLAALDTFDGFIERWTKDIEALQPASGYAEGEEMKANSIEGVQCFADAVKGLREYADTCDSETADSAMESARLGESILKSMQQQTLANIDRIEDELDRPEADILDRPEA